MRKAVIAAFGMLLPLQAGAADPDYPTKPVRIVVGFAPGGGVDIVARIVAEKMSEILKQTVLVDNRAGAGGSIGAALVAKSPADGYTLLAISSSYGVVPTLYKDLPFDPVKDFQPVSLLVEAPLLLLVHPSLPARSIRELIAIAKAKPGQLNYGTGGNGTSGHLTGELFKSLAGIDITHVPYKGAAPALIDLLAGQVSIEFASVLTTASHVKSGRLRALAVTSARRSALFPRLPTIDESGVPGFQRTTWYGVLAPARTPAAVIARLQSALKAALTSPETRSRFLEDGGEPRASGSKELEDYVVSEIALAEKIMERPGVER
jgi:tripartite-type tricarboxylate transporter receptor subunit TctC